MNEVSFTFTMVFSASCQLVICSFYFLSGKNVNSIGLVLVGTFEMGFEIQFSTWLFYSISTATVTDSKTDVVAHIL